jgi:hypothetical protein
VTRALVEALKEAADMPESGCASLLRIMHGHLGKVDAVVEAMKANRSDAQVQQLGCTALSKLVSSSRKLVDHDCSFQDLTEEVTAAVFEAMKHHGDDHKVISAGVEVLLRFEDVEGLQEAGISAVLSAMEANRSNSVLQEQALKILWRVYMPMERTPGKKYEEEIQKRADRENDDAIPGLEAATRRISAVVEAMRAHSKNQNLQDTGCEILLSLAGRNRVKVVEAGGLETVIEALETCQSDRVRDDWKNLAVLLNPDDYTQSRAGEAGAVEAVVKMIRTQVECKKSQMHLPRWPPMPLKYLIPRNNTLGKERAVQALMKLVPGHEGNRRRFVEAGGFEALKEQYRSSNMTSSHSEFSCGVLRTHTREALIALDPSWKPDDY